ncbi:MAG TPA: serine hydrolase domain-containing protein [Candidatus Limnocylindria bacterium]
MKRLLPLLAALTLAASCVTSGNDAPSTSQPTAAIQAYLDELNDDNFSGVVLVAKDFVPFATKATGYADRAHGAPNATITPFNIASVTKLFTAVAIGQLVDQGKVSLDDPLSKYLPTYPKPAADQITIAMLVGQTAGTGDYLSDPGYLRVRDSFESLSDLIGAVNTDVPAGTVPGTAFAFSSTGYLLLGSVIEKASGQDFYDYMDNEVFAPAGVAAGFLHNSEEERSDRGFALGYKPDDSQNWSGLPVRGTPATGAYATAPDLLSFHKALSTGALVKPETLKRLVLVPQTPGLTSGTFSGDDVGASAVFAMTPNGYTVIVLANVSGAAGPVADRILKLLASGS